MIFDLNDEDRLRGLQSEALRAELAGEMLRFLVEEGERETPIEGLSLIRRDHPTEATAYLYEPSLAVIVSGGKRVVLGETTWLYDASRFLLTSVELPTITSVVKATPQAPYLSLLLRLDLATVRQVMADIHSHEGAPRDGEPGMATGPATVELFDAVKRLVTLLDRPQDMRYIGALILREILYRVLTSPAGARLRQIVQLDTPNNRTAGAISWLREHFAQPLRIETLADVAGMGASTLHHQFRLLTSMSPLQYQKQLRLHEARRLLLMEGIDATSAALRVGYESATQFNREYRREFGEPPMRDVKRLRTGLPA